MKLHRVLSFSAAIALAQLALADEPAPPSAQTLGMMEGIVNRCAQVDPKAATRYKEQLKFLTQGASEKTVDEIRKSDEYKQAYDSATDMIGKVPEQEAIRACTAALVANK
jgi:hypothetical protein